MDAPVPFPEFESLPPIAQERLGGLARSFGITEQKAVMLTMLIAQGVSLMELSRSCRMMGLSLAFTDLEKIREEMAGWVRLEEYRKSVVHQLAGKEKLTQSVFERLSEARTREEILAIYFEVEPFEVMDGDNRGFGDRITLEEILSNINWMSLMAAPAKGRFKLDF